MPTGDNLVNFDKRQRPRADPLRARGTAVQSAALHRAQQPSILDELLGRFKLHGHLLMAMGAGFQITRLYSPSAFRSESWAGTRRLSCANPGKIRGTF
ncbi:MAG TPA: hypothetical protein VMR62_31610 [Bryobacteraceae bacterium]|jgi:hypothetical protein|nr:hypothetical protein [Bryobacteraceae bacterium]